MSILAFLFVASLGVACTLLVALALYTVLDRRRPMVVWSRFPPRCRECSQNHYPDAGCDPAGD